jgi:glycosyltransferase involved in cell wall biosynthesis
VTISILSAVHNEARYITLMLDSVRAQTYPDWELLIVSDGSDDGTDDLVRAASAADPRVRLVQAGQKIGKVAAFNKAFEASKGEYVVLLAGDDTLPSDSLEIRLAAVADLEPDQDKVVAYFKLQTMSDDQSRHGLVLPRGDAANHSGGTLVLTRALCQEVFPIKETLPSEDLWLGWAAEGLADDIREVPSVVLNYRIHPGNTNPRARPFPEMFRSMASRHAVWQDLLDAGLALSPQVRTKIHDHALLERYRLDGQWMRILTSRRLAFADRAAYASMTSPALYAIRQRFYAQLSGRRKR